MFEDTDEIVRASTGTLSEINAQAGQLEAAGIRCRVVGDDLTAGLGTLLPGSVELWVHAADGERAAAVLAGQDIPEPRARFPHPTSDPKPDRTDGPHHFPERHRPNP
jgi:hypothetical protein